MGVVVAAALDLLVICWVSVEVPGVIAIADLINDDSLVAANGSLVGEGVDAVASRTGAFESANDRSGSACKCGWASTPVGSVGEGRLITVVNSTYHKETIAAGVLNLGCENPAWVAWSTESGVTDMTLSAIYIPGSLWVVEVTEPAVLGEGTKAVAAFDRVGSAYVLGRMILY